MPATPSDPMTSSPGAGSPTDIRSTFSTTMNSASETGKMASQARTKPPRTSDAAYLRGEWTDRVEATGHPRQPGEARQAPAKARATESPATTSTVSVQPSP